MSTILECNDLTQKFGSKAAVSSVNLKIERGQIVGLLGPNGSGKSTLIKLANELLTPTSGNILIGGKKPGVETKKIISYLPEKTYLNEWMHVNQIIELFSDFYDNFKTEKAYDMLKSLNINPNDRLKTMSKGTKEKVQLILVMSREAELYLLDEPIGGVDPAARDYILNTGITRLTLYPDITEIAREIELEVEDEGQLPPPTVTPSSVLKITSPYIKG
ncbi:ATP-binding cassette domain-containing protein [Desulfosporosinus shakirovi]|uniref:ATP-binding cassette domain-containing protein n=1 Tax=Desulfosporosinus shakirovi TaxID=2885154 RepID=UPI001E3C56FE|nr:ABC transporter ATP-binding protein [Desulfosporosinus sp. SRJS8]MCB8814834.1 ABC transporter ATP-binding protein [Desulfosporosinus sp. SRJS8]